MFKSSLKLFALIIVVFQLFVSQLHSQQWIKTLSGSANGDDRVTNAVTDKAGNLYETGYVTRTGTGIDFCTVKYNSEGTQQWVAYYNNPQVNGEDKAFGIAVDNAGNVYITGYSAGIGSSFDYATVKYNSSGAQQWVQRYDSPANSDDKAFGIAVDNAGYVYVTGYVTLASTDIFTIKYTPAGVLSWNRLVTGNGAGDSKAFGIATDGINVYVTGYVTDSTSGTDIALIKYDSSGNTLWSNIYNGPGNSDDRAFGIAQDDGHASVFIFGYSSGNATGTDATLIKYNAVTGDSLWVARYNGTGNADDKALGIAVDHLGNSYITGSATDTASGTDYITMKYDPNGNRQWIGVYTGTGENEDVASDIVVPKQGNYVYVTGYSKSDTSALSEDMVTVKYSVSSGDQLQVNKYAGSFGGSDVGVKVVADTSGNVIIAGYTQVGAANYDWITRKFPLGDIISVSPISTIVPKDYSLYQNFPNPFNPSTKIKFDIKKAGIVKLIVFDVLGREVASLANQYMAPGSYEATVNLANLSSGVYFYKLTAGDYSEIKKMVLVK